MEGMAFEHWIVTNDKQNQVNAAAANDAQRERVTVYLDDWRRLQSERAELLAMLERVADRIDGAWDGPDHEAAARALLARIRG